MSQTPPPPTVPPPMTQRVEAPGTTAGLVLGIISIVLAFSCSLAGLICAIIGYQKSKLARQLCEQNPGVYANEGSAQGGYVCSIIGLILNILMTLLGCLWGVVVVGMILAGAAGII